ncbi:hypothetical protein DFQ28_011160 [Apophysomyces sp. BC1034]|nr:hypothetical protein DFQ30_010931 [Apophysomyces sp. BC1015]KAG0184415.1 hypothetical protein DFQ28_011160 [Apophysomyces sp. BC1034]
MLDENLADLDRLRSNIEFTSIAQFFHTFQDAFRPWPARFSDPLPISRTGIIGGNDLAEDNSAFATESGKASTRRTDNTNDTWQTYFAREFDKREPDESNPFYSNGYLPVSTITTTTTTTTQNDTSDSESDKQTDTIDFYTLTLETKVHLLDVLCNWQMEDPERFRDHLGIEDDPVQWRVDPIGYDAKGSSFWLFDDNRLYKETPQPKPKPASQKAKQKHKPARRSQRRNTRSNDGDLPVVSEEEADNNGDEEIWMPWKLICLTSEDWEKLPEKFANSIHLDEQRFHRSLVNDVLPKVLPVVQDHEKIMKKEAAIIHRKRSSRLMVRELQALESGQPHDYCQGGLRSSSRREEKARQREEQEKETAAKAREERLLERERRLMEREQAQQDQERRKERRATNAEIVIKKESSKRKRGRKPKVRKQSEDEDEESWTFDCVCGVSGQNMDDGSPMIACERCEIWQHIDCLRKAGQIDKSLKSLDNVQFVCFHCLESDQRRHGDASEQNKTYELSSKKPKIDTYDHSLSMPQSSVQEASRFHIPYHTNGQMTPIQYAPRQVEISQPLYHRPPLLQPSNNQAASNFADMLPPSISQDPKPESCAPSFPSTVTPEFTPLAPPQPRLVMKDNSYVQQQQQEI